ncbi:MAG: hypothetical protein ACLTAQ_01320 [Longicatena caecimuris]
MNLPVPEAKYHNICSKAVGNAKADGSFQLAERAEQVRGGGGGRKRR